jgi:two-component system response regulator
MPRKRIVLYADDDIDDKMWISEACKTVNESLDLHFVENGRQVLQYLHTNDLPSLIVLDLNMPDLDGRQTLKAIKNHVEYQHLPVAIVTTSSSRLDREVCIRLGAALFLTKPDTYSEWQQIVRRLEPLLTTPINF